jgi:glucose-1-phosphate thymidylyltransferase
MVAKVTTAAVLVSRANGHGAIDGEPTALTPVANRPLLLHVLDSLAQAGIEDVVLAADEQLAPEVERAVEGAGRPGLRLTHLALGELTLAAALSEVARLRGPTPVLVHFADSLSHDLAEHVGAASPDEHDALLLVQEQEQAGGAVLSLNGNIAALPGLGSLGEGWAPAGVAVFGSGAGAAARSLGVGDNHDLELVALAQRLASEGGRLEARSACEWLRLGPQPGALLEANRFALEEVRRGVPDEALAGDSDVQGSVLVDRTARLESAVVRGPAVIGAGARLTDAYVGPYSSIGDGVVIDGAEVEHSIVLSGSCVRHLGGRLEGSVIGPNAKIFRDFRLPHAVRLQVGEGAVVSVS